jgi:DNA-binding LytR/AlgR family response regulator
MKSYQHQTDNNFKTNSEKLSAKAEESPFFKKETPVFFHNSIQEKISHVPQYSNNLFRLFVKHFEYVYVRPNDIIMIESCDHLVKVYVGVDGKAKLTMRHNTLKDFLSQLPQTHFLRIGRFCAINIQRLTGGSCNEQVFEFDFKISIKLKHSVSHSVFSRIGI